MPVALSYYRSGALFFPESPSLLSQPLHLLRRQAVRGPQERRHLARVTLDDVGQIRRHPTGQREQLVRVLAKGRGDGPDLLLARRVEVIALNFGQVGRAHPDRLCELAQADLSLLSKPPHGRAEAAVVVVHVRLLQLCSVA